MAEDNRPSVYWDSDIDRWVYRASALGSCERELVAHRRGMDGAPVPDWLQVRFDEGHDWEDRILHKWEDDNAGCLALSQDTVILEVGKHAAVRGSIDGYDDRGTIVDAKFLGPDLFDRLKSKGISAFPHYEWQQAAYAHAAQAKGYKVDNICLAMGLKDIDQNAAPSRVIRGIAQMHYLWVDVADLPSVAQIKARVMRLEKLADADGWPDCPTPFQYPCPFDYLHDERDVAVEIEDPKHIDNLQVAANLYDRAKKLEAEAKSLKAEATEYVKYTLAAEDLTLDAGHKLRAGDLEVTWVYSKTEAAVIEKYERKESVRRYPQFKMKENTDG